MAIVSKLRANARQRPLLVWPLWLLVLACTALCAPPIHAWKPKTHIYIANVIREDAKDGRVWIPPFGEFSISPEARLAINAAPYFRAGAVGPDGFPDMWTGQAVIHPNTAPWLRHLWASAVARNSPQVWGFVYGYLVHCAGDVFAHDWVNAYAGRAFPAMAEIAGDPSLLNVVARHLAIETTLDNRLTVGERTISIPYDFVLTKMVLDPGAQQAGMNPLIQHYVSLYWEKYPHRNDTTAGFASYDARWFEDLGADLSYWVMANETALKRSVEQGEDFVGALTGELGEWAFKYILDMEGAPSGTVAAANAIISLSGAVQAALRAVGLDQVINNIRDGFVDWMLKTTMGMSAQQLKTYLMTEANQTLFPHNLNEILTEIGNPPAESGWVHDNTDQARFAQFLRGINGALYNSVILGKIALLPPSELNRLTRSQYFSQAGVANAMLGWIKGIDFSSQWVQGQGYGGCLGYRFAPDFPTFTYLFKPYPPVGRNDGSLFVRPGAPLSAVLKVTGRAPNGSSLFEAGTRDRGGSMVPVLLRRKGVTTGAWQELTGTVNTDQDFVTFELPFEYGAEYLVRPTHGRLAFTSPAVVKFDAPVDLRERKVVVMTTSSSTINQAAYAGRLNPAPATAVRPWCLLLLPRQPLAIEGNTLGLPSSAALKVTDCCLRVEGDYGPPLTGVSGVLMVDPREPGIAPVMPVQIGFTVDMDGVARFGAANLAEASRGPDQVTVKAGSHSGPLVLRVLFDVSEASLAGARVAEGYRRVQAGLKAIAPAQVGTDLQGVAQALAELGQTIGTAAAAESRMRAAIAGVTDSVVRRDLQQRFDSGLGTFPVFSGRGLVAAATDRSTWLSVQPNADGLDSWAVAPSFAAAALAAPPAAPGKAPGAASPATVAKTPEAPLPSPKKPDVPLAQKPDAPLSTVQKPGAPLPPPQKPGAVTTPTGPGSLRVSDGAQPFGGERPLGGGSPFALSVRRVEYRATPIRAGSEMIVPRADEKLLVVHLSLRNTQSAEAWADYSSVSFTAVDAPGVNREYCGDLFDEQTGESVDAALPTGQRVDAYTVVTMPARGAATRLTAQAAGGAPLEYGLGAAVSALEPPFADPADPTGASALAEVPAAVGAVLPVGYLTVTVEAAAVTRDRILKRAPGRGNQFLVATLRVKNTSLGEQPLYWESFDFALRSPQGGDIPWNQELLASGRDEELDLTLTPGREAGARIYFEVPQGAGPYTLFLRRGEGARAYLVDLGGVQ